MGIEVLPKKTQTMLVTNLILTWVPNQVHLSPSSMVKNIEKVVSMMSPTTPILTTSMARSGEELRMPTNGKRTVLIKLKNLTNGEDLVSAGKLSDQLSGIFLM